MSERLGKEQVRLLGVLREQGPMSRRALMGLGFRKRTMMSLNYRELIHLVQVDGKMLVGAA